MRVRKQRLRAWVGNCRAREQPGQQRRPRIILIASWERDCTALASPWVEKEVFLSLDDLEQGYSFMAECVRPDW